MVKPPTRLSEVAMSEEIAIAYADAGADLVEPTVHSGVRCCRAIHAFARGVRAASQRVLAILDAVARLWGAPIRLPAVGCVVRP